MNKRYAFRIQNSLELKVNDRTYDDSTNMKTYQNTDKSLISTSSIYRYKYMKLVLSIAVIVNID